ncbi:MAG: hypothetical protein CMJ83_21165 [Planctomycetes bacterium]|nr:hypothetical protein [Planctomycetota bacterium]
MRVASAVLVVVAVLAPAVSAQPPIQLNTTIRSFTTVSGSPWVADIWSYTDTLGNDYALVCRGNSGMSMYNINNPAAPFFTSSIALGGGSDMKDVKVYQNYAFALKQSGGTQIVDLSNPNSIQVVATITGSAHNGFVYENGPGAPLYLQARNGANPANLRIYDISNPAAPIYRGAWNPPSGDTHDVYAQDGLAYVNVLFGNAEGTYIIDISNPVAPTQVGFVPTGDWSHSCWMYNAPGNQKYLLECNETGDGHALIYNVTNPAAPTFTSEYRTATSSTISCHNPVIVGKYAYIAWYGDYLRILDLSRPSNPIEVGTYDPVPNNAGVGLYDGAWGVAFVRELPNGDRRLLLTESFSAIKGFWVIDFTPPPSLDVEMTSTNGDVQIGITHASPFEQIFMGISSQTGGTLGTGPLAGIGSDGIFTMLSPLGAQPFHVGATAAGTYDFSLPAGALPPGLAIDFVHLTFTKVGPCGRLIL